MNEEERLLQYINEDAIYQSWKNDELKNPSDFDLFCINHCKDIEVILNENKELKNNCKKIKEHINKIREEYMLMKLGKMRIDYEELLFQMEEGINEIIKDSDVK